VSAWIVSKAHIDVLVQAGITHGLVLLSPGTPDAVGTMLWTENHASVNYRYSERTEVPEYRFEGVEAPLDDLVVVKATFCYEYQACEGADRWMASEARRYCDNLIARIDAVHGPPSLGATGPYGEPLDPTEPGAWANADPRWRNAPGWPIDSINEALAS